MMATTSNGVEGSDSILEDMMLLLECLKFQKDCISSQQQALTTMATMCTSSATARDLFRSGGCLEYVVHLVKTTKSSEIMQAGLCALGCATEKNVSSQMRLSEEGMFTLLKDILNSKETTLLMKSTSVVMIISVLNSNGQGQKVAFETKLVSKLIDLFKTYIPFNNGTGNEKHIELWSNVAQALSAACDNPQNELNQNHCCAVFPVAVSLIQYAVGSTDHLTSPALLRPAITVLTSCVANNERAQDRLHMVGGLRALTLLLNTLIQTDQTFQSTLTKDHLSLALHIIRALCAASSNNANNITYLASFQVVHLLLHLLTHEDLDSFEQLSIVMCLETLTENNEVHQQHLLEKEGDRILISMMAESREEMLNKTIPVIIQTCLKTKKLTTDATAISSTSTQTHIQKLYSILHKMEELTERGDDNEEIPDSPSANFRLSPQPQTTGIDILDDALKDLGTKKLPLQVKIKEWLEKGEHKITDNTTEMKTYCTHLKSMLNTLIQRQQESNIIDDNASIPGPPSQHVHSTMLKEHSHCREDLNENGSVLTAPSIVIQSRLDKLEKQLAQEKEERLNFEQKLNEKQSIHIPEETVRDVIIVDNKQKGDYEFKKPLRPNVRQTSKPSPAITISAPNPSTRQCTPHPQHNRNLLVPPTPKRPNQRPNKIALFSQTSKQQPMTKHLPDVPVCSAINTPMSIASGLTNIPMSHSTPKPLQATTDTNASIDELFPTRTSHDCCLGCQSTRQVLTSRTFLPRLSLDKHTCRYHKKIAESILAKTVLILDVSHLNKSSQDRVLNTPRPATEVYSVVGLQPATLSQRETVECSNVDSCPHLISPPASAGRPSVSPQLQQACSTHNQQSNYPMMRDYKSDFNSKKTQDTITHNVSSTKRLQPPLINPKVYKPLQDIINQQKIPKRSKASSCIYDYIDETLTTSKKIKIRQVNLPYSKDEVKYLLKGVNELGPRWKHILMAYPFKTGRTAVSLKDKYRLLTKHK